VNAEPARPTLCIAVLTLNEERRIRQCLESARFADQVIVIDSGSTDQTTAIAQELGAEVHAYPDWQGFGVQRNRQLAHCRCDTIFFLDADEVIPSELQAEMQAALRAPDHGNTLRAITWREFAYGRYLDAMKSTRGIVRWFPTAFLQGFEGAVHEQYVLRSPATSPPAIQTFRTRVTHYSRESIYGSLKKLAQYAQLGANKRAAAGKTGGVLRGFGSALANFTRLYIFQRGFLCGPQGFLFCFFIALECFFRYVALRYDTPEVLGQHAKR
jgi:hypothetical protein